MQVDTIKEILVIGLRLWKDDPASVSARRIGKELNITHSAVLYHYGSAARLKDAIARYAVEQCDPQVIPMLIAARHPAVGGLTPGQRAAFLAGC